MSRLIGTVSRISGQVFAVAGDGTRRVLIEGDRVYWGEVLSTGNASAVAVRLEGGGELTVGRDSSLLMSPDLQIGHHSGPVDAHAVPASGEGVLGDVEKLQAAIVAGADPTADAEPTAVGPENAMPGPLGGGHSFILLSEVAGHVEPVIGFPTLGLGNLVRFEELPLMEVTVNVDTAALPVQVIDHPATGDPVVDHPVTGDPVTDHPVTDHPVSLGGLSNGGGLTVNEANLPLGSASDPAALCQTGSFTVSAADGLQTLSVGGISVVSGGVANTMPQSITTALGNTLSVTGYDAATGLVSYSYTLTGNDAHPWGDGANSLIERFTVTATDADGSRTSDSLNVTIIDDVPTAVTDAPTGVASESQQVLSGNVLDNDIQGADRVVSGPITAGTFVGLYGTLVLAANGDYTYTLHPDDPAFLALKGGGNGQESFTYTLNDSDGDTSRANLLLQVHNNDDPVRIGGLDASSCELTVYEKNLDNGSSPDHAALTRSGTFTVSAADGLANLTVGAIVVMSKGVINAAPQSLTTALGNTLTVTGFDPVTGVVSYSYTLDRSEEHPAGQGANSIAERFSVSATDVDGSASNASLTVNIVDDLPSVVSSVREVSVPQVDSNLLLILDVSNSMEDWSGVGDLSRLDLAKQALETLLDKYAGMGDVRVQLVTFSTHANDQTSTWVDVATAKAIISGLSVGDQTNYSAGIHMAQEAFATAGKLAGAQNIAYFLSDGQPTQHENITHSLEHAYNAFLDANQIRSYAIGIGDGVSDVALNPAAYDGVTHSDTNAVLVSDLHQLDAVLANTVQGASISGNLLNGGTFGADGGFIKSISIDGNTFTYDPRANGNQGGVTSVGDSTRASFDSHDNSLTINSHAGGTLVLNMDSGAYTYTPPKASAGTTISDTFEVQVSDNDGDLANASLTLKVVPGERVAGGDTQQLSHLLEGGGSLDDLLHFKLAGSATAQSAPVAAVEPAVHVPAPGADAASVIHGMLDDHSLRLHAV